jgi:putative ABC transport system permease protein
MRNILPFRNNKDQKRYNSIKTSVLFYIAWKNFIDRKLRSFLTVLAVVIGVTAILFLLSFGLGIQELVTQQVVGSKSLKSVDVVSPNSKIIKLDSDAVETVKAYPHVQQVGVQYSFPGIMKYNGGEIDVVAYGLNQQYQSLSSLNLLSGRLLEANDDKAVVVNMSALKSVGIEEPNVALDQKILITVPLERVEAKVNQIAETFTVVGIVESGSGSEIFMPSGIYDTAGVPTYSNMKVVVDDTSNVASVRSHIESSGFQTTSLVDTLTEIDNIFKFFNMILVGIGSVGMVVAILGMFNTLTISLLERTKEIGLMIALGARRSDMRKLFIMEAILISFIGAIFGTIVAILMGQIVNLYVNIGAAQRGVSESFNLFSTPLWSLGMIVLGTIVVGVIVVYVPARRAERINPIDALRRE